MLLTNTSSNISTIPIRQTATATTAGTNSSSSNLTSARGSIPIHYSFVATRASNCTLPVQPPANCNGNGTFDSARCTCNCFTGFVNDLSNLVSPQWCKAVDPTVPGDGRPGTSPTPAPTDGTTPTTNTGGKGGGGFTRTRMFYIIIALVIAAALACVIWCYIRIRRRRARREKKRKGGRKARKRYSSSSSSDMDGTDSSSVADSDGSSSSSSSIRGSRSVRSVGRGSRASHGSRASKVARSKGSGSSSRPHGRSSTASQTSKRSGRYSNRGAAQQQVRSSSPEKKRPKLSSLNSPAAAAVGKGGRAPWDHSHEGYKANEGWIDEEEGGWELSFQQQQQQHQYPGARRPVPNLVSSPGGRSAAAGRVGSPQQQQQQQQRSTAGVYRDDLYDDFDLRQVQVVVDATGGDGYESARQPLQWDNLQQQQQQQRQQRHDRQRGRQSVPIVAAGAAYGGSSSGSSREVPKGGLAPGQRMRNSMQSGPGAMASTAAAVAAQRARLAASAPGGRMPADLELSDSPQQRWQRQQQQQQQRQQQHWPEGDGWQQ